MEQSAGSGGASDSASGARVAKVTKIVKLARFLRLARMIKLLNLQGLWEMIELSIGGSAMNIIHLIKVWLAVMFLCHWNACLWWAIGAEGSIFNMEKDASHTPRWTNKLITRVYGNEYGEEWTVEYTWADDMLTATDRYIFCFYWTLGVMRTMPTEVFPVNLQERTYGLAFVFIAFIYFAICISRLTQVYNKWGARRTEFDDQFSRVKYFLISNDVDADVAFRIRQFLEYQFAQGKIFAKEANILRELSETLNRELKCALYMTSVRSLPYFLQVSFEHIHPVVLLCYCRDMGPSELISIENTIAHRVSIIESGVAERGSQKRKSTIDACLRRGSCVDGDCLLLMTDTMSEETTTTVSFCSMVVINKYEFIQLRLTNPQLDAVMIHFTRSTFGAACVRSIKQRRIGKPLDAHSALERVRTRCLTYSSVHRTSQVFDAGSVASVLT